jgi:hypothetical protein
MLRITDPALLWLLRLGPSAALTILALGTAVVLTMARKITTNQDLLRRCSQDRKVLKRRIREARRRDHSEAASVAAASTVASLQDAGAGSPDTLRDDLTERITKALRREEVAQLSGIRGKIALKAMKSEALPVLVAIVPVVFLAAWAFERVGFHPPRAGQPVVVRAHFQLPEAGRLAFLTPAEGLHVEGDNWIRTVEATREQGQAFGVAEWTLRGEARPAPYRLVVRMGDHEYRHDFLIGQPTYTDPIAIQGGDPQRALEIIYRPVKLFGLVPGLPWAMLPPWMVGYLVLVIPLVPLLKRTLRIW